MWVLLCHMQCILYATVMWHSCSWWLKRSQSKTWLNLFLGFCSTLRLCKTKMVYIKPHVRDVGWDWTSFLKQVEENKNWCKRCVSYWTDLCCPPLALLFAVRVSWLLGCPGGSRVGCERLESFDIPAETFDHR